jgi:hypothetical protein
MLAQFNVHINAVSLTIAPEEHCHMKRSLENWNRYSEHLQENIESTFFC